MQSFLRAAALSAVALAATQVASAGFVYQSTDRAVSVSVAGSVADSEQNFGSGSWFGSANALGTGYTGLATQGSNLGAMEMTFVGAAQLEASVVAALMATSTATIEFLADSTESISWIAGLARQSSGAGNSASIGLSVVDIASGDILLAFSGPSNGSGSFDVVSGRSYRVSLSAMANLSGASSSSANYNVGFFSSVPTPGAIALLGLAGLAGRRRR
ncbi:MAG: hypothetical protein RL136_1127 [Planctomycetota bacterium]|jgi:hypothetical protein